MPGKEASANFLPSATAHEKHHLPPQCGFVGLMVPRGHRANKCTCLVDLQNPHKSGLVETGAKGYQGPFLLVFRVEQSLLAKDHLYSDGLQGAPRPLDKVVFFVGSIPPPIQSRKERDAE